jgi:isoquinoline 1-oxidoreductase alpha subunit
VIVDDRAVMSCSVTIAELEGARITTIEGLSSDRSHPVQQAWLAEQVTMCGYCEPGFIMAIAALLKSNPAPSEEDIAALPNICRCGAYPRVRKAIARAARTPPSLTDIDEQTEAKRFSGTSSAEEQKPGDSVTNP